MLAIRSLRYERIVPETVCELLQSYSLLIFTYIKCAKHLGPFTMRRLLRTLNARFHRERSELWWLPFTVIVTHLR